MAKSIQSKKISKATQAKSADKIATPAVSNVPAVITTTPAPIAAKTVITRFTHGVSGTYTGASGSFGKKKSNTPINTLLYNTLPHASLTGRDNAFLNDIKLKYGAAEFKRGDFDAGNMRRAIERGYIIFVSGNIDQNGYTTGDASVFKLTDRAIASKFA